MHFSGTLRTHQKIDCHILTKHHYFSCTIIVTQRGSFLFDELIAAPKSFKVWWTFPPPQPKKPRPNMSSVFVFFVFFFRRPVRPECIHEVKLLTPPSIKNQKNTPALNLTNLTFKVIPWAELPKSLSSLFKISLWKLGLKDKVTGTRVGWVMTENGLEWCTPLAHVVSSWSLVFIILPLAINSYCKWMCWACSWSCSWLKACTNLLQSRLVLD